VFVKKTGWWVRVPGIYLGDTFEEGFAMVEKLLSG
jgi:hypothetical protein